MKRGRIKAINISEKKGVIKTPIDRGRFLEGHGLEGDAHAGKWHRQVSLLADESVDKMRNLGVEGLCSGKFAENLTTEGIGLHDLPVGTRLKIGGSIQEVTQIGKECHDGCAIKQQVGQCIMPKEGIFTRVVKTGEIAVGDAIEILEGGSPMKAAILVASDKGSRGERYDESGRVIETILIEAGYHVLERVVVPDEQAVLEAEMIRLADDVGVTLLVTTGGTGFSKRDVTPEATLAVIERLTPGIPEAMRALSLEITPRAMLSRAAAGIRKETLIVNLPGSPKAVKECLDWILEPLAHGLDILLGEASECAR